MMLAKVISVAWTAMASMAALANAQPASGSDAPLLWVCEKTAVSAYLNDVGPYTFLIDVGASQPILDKAVATYLSLPPGKTPAEAALAWLRIGAFTGVASTAALSDLAPLQGRLGSTVAGLLPGRLGAAPLIVDYPAGTVSYGRAASTSFRFSAPMVLEKDGLRADVLLNGRHLRPCVVDSTYGGALALPEALAIELQVVADDTPRLEVEKSPESDGLDGHAQVRLRKIAVGGAELADPLCTLVAEKEPLRVGTGFLRHYRVAFDYEAGKLWLAPVSSETPRSPDVTGFGLILGKRSEGGWTLHVTVNGPAYQNGIRSGDRLSSINGEDMTGAAYDEVAAFLNARPGRKIKLGVQRGDQTKEADLTAERIF